MVMADEFIKPKLGERLYRIFVAVFFLSFIITPFSDMKGMFKSGYEEHDIAMNLGKENIARASFISNKSYADAGPSIIKIAWFSENAWYCHTLNDYSTAELLKDAKRYNIKYYFYFYEGSGEDYIFRNQDGKVVDDITNGSIKGLKIYPIGENEGVCNFEKILNAPETPELAKALFYNKSTYSEIPLNYFSYLKNNDEQTRAFYFRVITNSYKIADGAYSEELGNLGKEFIENNPKDFAIFFDNKACFDDKDLQTWAKIVLLEFEIIDESFLETGKGEPSVNEYCRKLLKESEGFKPDQKETIRKFNGFLLNEWRQLLMNMG
jgi:hypothetical protein